MPAEVDASLAIEVLADAEAVAEAAAAHIARELSAAISERGRATLAISGGRTPLRMLALLAAKPLPWGLVDVFQVDERFAPWGHAERNASQALTAFNEAARPPPASFHWMPVDNPEPRVGARAYAAALLAAAGDPPLLDVVHLGLGADGHTASLFPGASVDAVTAIVALAPAPSGAGRPRMTLTLAALNGARQIVWTITGSEKRAALAGLLAEDAAIVGSRVRRTGARVFADRDAVDADSSERAS